MSNRIKLFISLVVPQLAGAIGVLFTPPMNTGWFQQLPKPPLNPPSWVFGPVWTLLYLAMGIALYLVWKKGVQQPHVRTALVLFGVQLILNASWSLIFFGAQSVGSALIVIHLMWCAIVATMIAFSKISKSAVWLLVPYLLWVTFATYLNAAIWFLL